MIKKLKKLKRIFLLFKKINNNGIKFVLPKFFLGYVIAGLCSVFFLLSIQNFLINYLKIDFFNSQLISTLFALLISFSINNFYTFSSKKFVYKKLLKFLLTNFITICLNIYIALNIFIYTQNWLISSLSGIMSAVFLNFIIYKYKIWFTN